VFATAWKTFLCRISRRCPTPGSSIRLSSRRRRREVDAFVCRKLTATRPTEISSAGPCRHSTRRRPISIAGTVTYAQEELATLLRQQSGIDFGEVQRLEPLQRGPSGRIVRLRIVGSRRTIVVGKELEIRRWLSPSHLYSSAFVVKSEGGSRSVPAVHTARGGMGPRGRFSARSALPSWLRRDFRRSRSSNTTSAAQS